jgi:cell division protein FtsZ
MPRMEDFPKPVQQARTQAGDDHEDDRRPMGLLRRIAESALGRSKEGAEHGHAEPTLARQPAPPQARAPQPQPPRQPVPQQPQPRPAAPSAQDYAKQQQRPAQPRMPLDAGYRPATGQLDPQGRQAPMPRSEDDQLEIPAFLRRQTN